MANAEVIFDQLDKEGFSRIQQMISEKQEENLFLDFKLKTDSTTPVLSKDDRKNYAKALSGFSNASGGVIIWGLDCSKNDEGLDAAKEIKPISQLKVFLGNLNSLLSSALTPLNTGIRNIAIQIPEDHDKGLIVTYIPESDLPPHRAMLNVNQYFTRSGESFMMMEHVHLEDMFGKRQKPVLDIHYDVKLSSVHGGKEGSREYAFSVIFGIKNLGRYVARYPAIRIKPNHELKIDPSKAISFSVNIQSHKNLETNGYMFTGGANDVIHPETFISVNTMDAKIKDIVFLEPSSINTLPEYNFEYTVYAEGCAPVSGRIEIPLDEVKKGLYPYYK